MEDNCLNCHHTLTGKYCSNCGQSAATHKINIHFLWHDIQHGLLHIDKGILFTTKELFTRPGDSIREFIDGKRVKHFKPISLVLVLAGVYGLLYHFFKINMLSHYIEINGSNASVNRLKEIIEKMTEWITEHYSILALLQIPIYTVGTYIGFRRSGYNFIEHLIINTFLVGQRLILHIITFPFYYMSSGTLMLRKTDNIIFCIGYALAIWTLFQLFKNQKLRLLKIIVSLCISLFIILLLLAVGLVVLFKFFQ